MIKNFSQFINESKQEAADWSQIYGKLSTLNSPKKIQWTDADGANVSLNWGSAKSGGYSVGVAIKNYDPRVSVIGDGKDAVIADLLKAGLKNVGGEASWEGVDPTTAIAALRSIILKYKL